MAKTARKSTGGKRPRKPLSSSWHPVTENRFTRSRCSVSPEVSIISVHSPPHSILAQEPSTSGSQFLFICK